MHLELGLTLMGLILIIAGAHFLTEGASSVARRFRIPQVIIGLTIVAFGTSAPELTVSVLGSLADNGGIAVGNVIGSNIFNGLAILGIAALIFPLNVHRNLTHFDIPISIIAAIMLTLVIADQWIDGMPSSLLRSEALILLVCGIIYFIYMVVMGRRGAVATKALEAEHKKETEKEDTTMEPLRQSHLLIDIIFIVSGLLCLVVGGNWFVDNASKIAASLGVSDTLIGLTLVAWGTSIPELATSVVAAIKKNSGIAVGNIVGSNIFNIFFVLGIAGTIHPLSSLQFTIVDVMMQLFASILVFAVAIWFGQRKITRAEGIGMLLIFVVYNYYIISQAVMA